MVARAVHFALAAEQATRLMETPGADDEFVMECISEIEEAWDREWLAETDKAWDAIHRCLTDGKLEYGDSVFHKCILGWCDLLDGDDGFLANFLPPNEVQEVAAAIADLDRNWFHQKYLQIDEQSYQGTLSEEDFEYTWNWFALLREFYLKAADAGRAVLFTVDQ